MDSTDGHNAPAGVHAKRRKDRGMDELLGMCKGIIADKVVNQSEAEFLLNWIESNKDICNEWPANVLCYRLTRYLEDGELDKKEQKELFELLKGASGGLSDMICDNSSTTLPVKECEDICFEDSLFCCTGTFVFGKRGHCEGEIVDRGGKTHKDPGQKTDYLVIGLLGSRDWIHSSYGRKIEKAVKLREDGHKVKIISEETWAKALFG
ncbi:MAG TPA: hypothetical protein DCS48_11075 [Desulfovibrio sp.]|nr:hypothetical protein [Desulfovibrio sp.]